MGVEDDEHWIYKQLPRFKLPITTSKLNLKFSISSLIVFEE